MITVPGRYRDRLTPADANTACSNPETSWIFQEIINLTIGTSKRPDSKRLRSYTTAAKNVCGGCPIRMACLEVHGRDYELGVVGGLTDGERRKLYDGAA